MTRSCERCGAIEAERDEWKRKAEALDIANRLARAALGERREELIARAKQRAEDRKPREGTRYDLIEVTHELRQPAEAC